MTERGARTFPNPSTTLTLAFMLTVGPAFASDSPADLLACADPSLVTLEAPALAARLRDAGGRDCRVSTLPWATRIECERVERLAIGGIPVRSLSAEVTDGGLRRLVAVTGARVERLEAALGGIAPAPGIERAIEAREDGASLVRCTAPAAAGVAGTGSMSGTLPPPVEGALGWQVCAVPASGGGGPCVEVANEVGWRIDGLAPGSWRVRADPIGGSRGTCALAADRLRDAPGPVPVLAMRPFEVRTGSTTMVGELRIAHGSACRG